MAEVTGTAPQIRTAAGGGIVRNFLQATEVDARLLGMIVALAIIWVGFQFASGGVFLTPRNLWNLSVQTATIAVLANGMVLIIVSRNIDLSVGSLMGFVGMIMGALQTELLPAYFGYDHATNWVLAVGAGVVSGALLGAFQGFIIAYLQVPAFIVTLGGLLVWRGAAWWVASGKTLAPLDTTFQIFGGGGAAGSIGATWSWIVGIIACVAIIASIFNGRRQRRRFQFPLRPVWAEITLGVIGCVAALGAVTVINAYPMPVGLARTYAEQHNIPIPESGSLFISLGIAVPVLIALGCAIVVQFLSTRTRFGRYVFAIGGNPDAAVLGGINTRWVILKTFVLMGVLCGIAAVIATARLNAATNSLGTNNELYTIAATVIGGTSFAGGIGTIWGAMLGALLMQSLQSGMQLMGIDSPLQAIVVGIVLVLAVGIDTAYRRLRVG
ncbi:MAG TPA: sugar ABC transporter permease [Bauldia sp.]|nr:sugar ABC transporter permease [Bauldia sp.]